MRDLLDRPESGWAAERARIETEGWGEHLLAFQDRNANGRAVHTTPPARTSEAQANRGQQPPHSLSRLRTFGLDPDSESARRTAALAGENCCWEEGNHRYWDGEVEPYVNGITVANGSYFGVDTTPIVDRLIDERLSDGGWNCEATNGSIRASSDTTINVLEGLLEFERTGRATRGSQAARKAAEEYLLERDLFKRITTGEPADDEYLHLRNPVRWQYDILRGLDYFCSVGLMEDARPDQRLKAAIERIRAKRQAGLPAPPTIASTTFSPTQAKLCSSRSYIYKTLHFG